MTTRSSDGFTIVEAVLVLAVLLLTLTVGLFAFGQISSKDKLAKDAIKTESLNKSKKELGERVTADKTIPDSITTEDGVSYARKDNQSAELCATFALPRSGAADTGTNPIEVFKSFFSVRDTTHQIYRDNVDFAQHTAGRNCYAINYAPINEAYNKSYEGKKSSWNVCDALRGYASRFTGQTIKGFFIGGSFTTNPGTSGGRAVLAQDADAYDGTCKKIPISALKVGDKVEMYIEDGPRSGNETIYYVKAIKKEF